MPTITDTADIATVLALSDERDQQLTLRLAAWREGYAAAAAQFTDHYERGWADAALALKAAQHEVVSDLALELRRWDGLRERFADPRRGDFPGDPDRPPPTGVWLGGPPVHWHKCIPACYAYKPGWYSNEDAARILATLPGPYYDTWRDGGEA